MPWNTIQQRTGKKQVMNTTWKDLKLMMFSEKSQSQKVTQHNSKYNILKMTKIQKWRTDQWFPGDKDGVGSVGVTIMGQHEGVPLGEKTGLYLDYGGGSTNLHVGSNCTELYIHTYSQMSPCKTLVKSEYSLQSS